MAFPEVPKELLDRLEANFPDQAPRRSDGGLFAFGEASGAQQVLDLLRRHYKKQQEASHV